MRKAAAGAGLLSCARCTLTMAVAMPTPNRAAAERAEGASGLRPVR